MLNLYCLKRTDNYSWDQCIGDVVAAENEEKAKEISHVGLCPHTIKLVGVAAPEIEAGIILDSFNAG